MSHFRVHDSVQLSLKSSPFQPSALLALLYSSASLMDGKVPNREEENLEIHLLMASRVDEDMCLKGSWQELSDVYVCYIHRADIFPPGFCSHGNIHGLIFLSSCHILSVHAKMRLKSFTCNYHICSHYIPSMWSLQHYGGCKCTETFSTVKTIFPARHGSIHLKSYYLGGRGKRIRSFQASLGYVSNYLKTNKNSLQSS